MLVEEWRDIKGYEGLYRISNYGNVLGVKRGKVLANNINISNNGCISYLVSLCKGGIAKKVQIHRLVYNTFMGDIIGMIDFKDGDCHNYKLDNLIDVNKTYNFKSKQCTKIIDTLTMKVYDSMSDLAKHLEVTHMAVNIGINKGCEKYSHYKIINNA